MPHHGMIVVQDRVDLLDRRFLSGRLNDLITHRTLVIPPVRTPGCLILARRVIIDIVDLLTGIGGQIVAVEGGGIADMK